MKYTKGSIFFCLVSMMAFSSYATDPTIMLPPGGTIKFSCMDYPRSRFDVACANSDDKDKTWVVSLPNQDLYNLAHFTGVGPFRDSGVPRCWIKTPVDANRTTFYSVSIPNYPSAFVSYSQREAVNELRSFVRIGSCD